MTDPEKFALIVASVPAAIALLGIYGNYELSKKLKTTDEEEKEKRKLRTKIQDRLAEFEEQYFPTLEFSLKLSQRFIYIARNVKIYDSSLSTMIRVFVLDWKKRLPAFSGGTQLKPEPSEINYFKNHIDRIGERADSLLANLSVVDRVKILLSGIRFRISLAKRNRQQKVLRENIKIKDSFSAVLRDENGEIKDV